MQNLPMFCGSCGATAIPNSRMRGSIGMSLFLAALAFAPPLLAAYSDVPETREGSLSVSGIMFVVWIGYNVWRRSAARIESCPRCGGMHLYPPMMAPPQAGLILPPPLVHVPPSPQRKSSGAINLSFPSEQSRRRP